MALAAEVFFHSQAEPQRLICGFKRFIWATGPRGVMGGQAAESLLGNHSTLDELKKMHAQKTGALFSAAILIPKEFAGISDDSQAGQSLIHFGQELGLAFQVADDLEDALQDNLTNKADHAPTSVLYYLPKDQASKHTLNSLQLANSELDKVWGKKSAPLRKIADEVAFKIEAAMGNSA